MTERSDDRELLRLLTGELADDDRDGLTERLAADPDLASRFAELEAEWRALELPPVPTADLSARVIAALRQETGEAAALGWSGMPRWARAAAVLALAVGIALGAAAGWKEPESDLAWTELDPTLAWELDLDLKGAER